MAYETLDFYIRPEDGWVEVADDPTNLIIRPSEHRPWWLAVTSGGDPNTATLYADGTITMTDNPSADDTVTIGGEVFTFVVAATDPFEVEIGTGEEETGDNLAAAINADSTVANAASNGSGVVTVTAKIPGVEGNEITLAEDADNTTVSGALLDGGLDPVEGLAFGRGGDEAREGFESNGAFTGKVFIRIKDPNASYMGARTHFGVVRNQ